ncbi:MAG: ECF transporter S component [Candidatus Riflebacteria bacterium]|nr:ECF transporter S component [Candidatus Riflebacteria bacterium]
MPGSKTREVTTAALLVASGIVIPIAFHSAGLAGRVFLPMHLPVAMAGLLVGWRAALAVGALTPLVSSLLTGMPPLAPMPVALVMALELSAHAATVSLLHRRWRLRPPLAIAGGIVAGRITTGLVYSVLVRAFGFRLDPFAAVAGALLVGWPGLTVQLTVVPALFEALARRGLDVGVGPGRP